MMKRIVLATLLLVLMIGSAIAAPATTTITPPQLRAPEHIGRLVPQGQNAEHVEAPVTNNVKNAVNANTVTSSNLIPNPSLETVSTKNKNLPLSWNKYSYAGKATFTYLTTGGYDSSRCVEVQSNAANVDAYWKYDLQPVTGGEQYEYSVMYKATTPPEVMAEVMLNTGQEMWMYLGDLPTSTTWTKYDSKILFPKNAVEATIYTGILTSGYCITDNYSLAVAPAHTGFSRAIVSITDDEAANWYKNAYPIFKKYGDAGTFYIISGDLNSKWTMTKSQFADFSKLGWEIGAHTVDHPDLTTVNTTQLDSELKDSQATLSAYFGVPVPDFATPYGNYNDQVITYIKKYYQSHRTTENDFNGKDNFDPYKIEAFEIDSNFDANYTKALIDRSIRDKTWLVLVYHNCVPKQTSDDYAVTTANLDTTLSYLKTNNVPVVTISQGLTEVKAQMATPI
jgi:peptidoglycan/xylan/chitin deacetylase (PgdA/CDA1 family)